MGQQEQKVDKWKTVYNAVRAALDFRVANLTSQQQRIANVLFANGLIFGFLGASAGILFDANASRAAHLACASIDGHVRHGQPRPAR